MPGTATGPKRKKENSFFPGKNSVSEKPGTLFTVAFPTSSSFSESVHLPSPGDLHGAHHGCRRGHAIFLLIPNKPIFAEEISGSLFLLGQQFIP